MLSTYFKKIIDILTNEYLENKINPKEYIESLINKAMINPNLTEAKQSTVVSRISKIKKYIRDTYPEIPKDILYDIKAPLDLIENVSKKADEKRSARANVDIDKSTISMLKSLHNSDNFLEQIIYVLFITGRRINEIINDIPIKKTPRKNTIIFQYLSKQKIPKESEVFVIPGVSVQTIIKLIKKIRDTSKVLKLSVNQLTKRVHRILRGIKPGLTPHMLRGIYAVYNYKFHNKLNQNKNGFIQSILNHDSQESSLNYINYELVD